MKSIPQFIEPLEPRIAPAILVNGGNLLGGKGNPTSGETSSGGNTVNLINVTSGQALVFFDATAGAITSISVGNHATLDITGDVSDIVTNLGKNGRLTDTDGDPSNGEDGGILLPSKIDGITTHALVSNGKGSIGRIIAGGRINNVTTEDPDASIHGIYAGDGVFRNGPSVQVSTGTVDYNSIVGGVQNIFTLLQSDGQFQSGASINTARISVGQGLEVFAGSGQGSDSGPGGKGGGITGVDVVKSLAGNGNAPGIILYAGDGGKGTDGGAGGAISNFTDEGSNTLVRIQTGKGGDGFDGNGGAGGSFIDSTITTKSPTYRLQIGDGGAGTAFGGNGGNVKGLSFTANIETGEVVLNALGVRSTGTLIASGDFNGDNLGDVVVVNSANGNAVVSLATPGGASPFLPVTQSSGNTFLAPQGLTPSDIVTGDFNGDGRLDFAVSYFNSDNLGVFFNAGGGVFQPSQVALSHSPYRLVAGDFTGSAAADLAYLVLSDTSVTPVNSQVFVVENTGAGIFVQHPVGTTIAGSALDLAAAPFNGDARTDIFVSVNSTINTNSIGFINSLVATASPAGAPFAASSVIQPALTSITNIDAVVTNAGAVRLLAFTDSHTTGTGTDTATGPALRLIVVDAAGRGTAADVPDIDANATLARFIGTAGDYGVLASSSVQVGSFDGAFPLRTYTLATGKITNFAPLANPGDGSDPIVAVGPIPTRFFYNAGDSLAAISLPEIPQIYAFNAGNGGHGGAFAGGKGGAIKTLTFTESLDDGADQSGGRYTVALTSGAGGGSDAGRGGQGGGINKVSVTVDPADNNLTLDAFFYDDTTTLLTLRAGRGGDGVSGGKGGAINKLTAGAVFDQIDDDQLTIDSFAVEMVAGDGGVGSGSTGGDGGSITLDGKASLTGITYHDPNSPESLLSATPALLATGGNGGDGAIGGKGGSLINIGAQNAIIGDSSTVTRNMLNSAQLTAGRGGKGLGEDGGAGGDVIGADLAVQSLYVYPSFLKVQSGDGGLSQGGAGGNGGKIDNSALASAQGNVITGYGVLAQAGDGGAGTSGGGKGGNVHKLTVNSPSNPDIFGAVIIGGNGGVAESGDRGIGGSIKGVTQSKDVNSSINLIAAGDGRIGGSVKNVKTVGFIGAPISATENNLGAFNGSVVSAEIQALYPNGQVPQGIFAGRGDAGSGTVENINARQIAAIGAGPNANGVFGLAALVSNVNADLIGFEVIRDNAFQSTAGGGASPAAAQPVDGFILAAAIEEINTVNNARTALFTFLG
jgi:hypothetical protein